MQSKLQPRGRPSSSSADQSCAQALSTSSEMPQKVVHEYTPFPQGCSHLECRPFLHALKLCFDPFTVLESVREKCVIVTHSLFAPPIFFHIFQVQMFYLFVSHTRYGTHMTENERKGNTSIISQILTIELK